MIHRMGEQGQHSWAADEGRFLPTRWQRPVQWVRGFPNQFANRQDLGVREGSEEEMGGMILGIRVQLALVLESPVSRLEKNQDWTRPGLMKTGKFKD
jgi:hypothetical protein